MGAFILIYLIYLLFIISLDSILGFALFLLWKYLDLKYFSVSEIELLREENKYLKEENKKVKGSSSEFWGG